MSGIAGIISLSGSQNPMTADIRRMSAAQAHRGEHEILIELPGVALANRWRSALSIDHCLHGETGQGIACVFDGALFGGGRPSRETPCDSSEHPGDYLRRLWQNVDLQILDQLRGQFAFALWNERERRLLIARDHFGICPIHWSQDGDWLLFASEIKAIFASGLVKPRVDLRGIHHVWTFFGIPGPITCFEGVTSLTPRH